MLYILPTPPGKQTNKPLCHSTHLSFGATSCTLISPVLTEQTLPPRASVETLRGPRRRSHPSGRGHQAQAPARAPRGVGARAGGRGRAGKGVLGRPGCREEGSPRQRRPPRRCALRAAPTAPRDPEAQAHFRRKERKKLRLARISGSQSRLGPQHRHRTPLSAALASPLPIFGLVLEEPVPRPRVAEAVTRVSPAAGPLSPVTLPSRAPFPPSPPAAVLPPLPRAARPALASSGVAVTGRLCCETKSDPWAPRPRPRARDRDARGPSRARRGGGGGGGAADAAPRHPTPAVDRARAAPAPRPVRRLLGRLLGVGTAARYAEPPGRTRRRARKMGTRVGRAVRGRRRRPRPRGIRALHVEGCV